MAKRLPSWPFTSAALVSERTARCPPAAATGGEDRIVESVYRSRVGTALARFRNIHLQETATIRQHPLSVQGWFHRGFL